ncbi:carbohydrate ABC transporter permease [Fastidiosipila sanguinis]|uniref:Sugar ABC transporter permease n=1 Tax=Fastidiosipila sanguinis TaxID=236753 RepID=A0A2S0KKZ7_9FIRM|nr:sugar ABC transporter permease [Fastidiosipila sanguinis]AVM41713.1 sugar ABC transporter permease [Fastidiosipila sanguinis]
MISDHIAITEFQEDNQLAKIKEINQNPSKQRSYVMGQKIKDRLFTYSMIWPALLTLIFVSIVPIIAIINTSLTNLNLIKMNNGAEEFIRFENYKTIFQDSNFWQSIEVTVKFTLIAVFTQLALGMLMAVFVHKQRKGIWGSAIKIILLLPNLCPPISMILIWQTMYSNNYGVINQILNALGIGSVNWLQDINVAFFAVLIVDIWQYAPFVYLLLYTSLTQFPKEMEEAANIDGASSWQMFKYITLPYLGKTLGIVALLRTIDTFRLFDKVNVLTGGGPYNSTRTITMYIYQTGIDRFELGMASASSILMTIVVLILAIPYLRSNFQNIRRSSR